MLPTCPTLLGTAWEMQVPAKRDAGSQHVQLAKLNWAVIA